MTNFPRHVYPMALLIALLSCAMLGVLASTPGRLEPFAVVFLPVVLQGLSLLVMVMEPRRRVLTTLVAPVLLFVSYFLLRRIGQPLLAA